MKMHFGWEEGLFRSTSAQHGVVFPGESISNPLRQNGRPKGDTNHVFLGEPVSSTCPLTGACIVSPRNPPHHEHNVTGVPTLSNLPPSVYFSIPKVKQFCMGEGVLGAESWRLRGGSDNSPTFS